MTPFPGPTHVISKQNAEHYTWGARCDGWHLVKQADLSVIEERMPPGASEVRHHHVHSRQFFYCLSGELTLEVEHHEYVLRPGEGIEILPGQRHQALNRSHADAGMLVISQPPSHGDRVLSE
jgi:mannose-6-phosphate isomerase-like protein (cupin superfamily)